MNLKTLPILNQKRLIRISDAFSDSDKDQILKLAHSGLSSKKADVLPFKDSFLVFSSTSADKGDFWNEGVYVRGLGAGELYGPGLYSNWNPEQTAQGNYGKYTHVFVIKPDVLKDILICDAYIYEKVYKKKPRAMSVSSFATLGYLFDTTAGRLRDPYDGDFKKDFSDICKGTGNSYCSDFLLDQIREKAGADGVLRFLTGCHTLTLSEFLNMDDKEWRSYATDLKNYTPEGLTDAIMKKRGTTCVSSSSALKEYIESMCHNKFKRTISDYTSGFAGLERIYRSASELKAHSREPGSVFMYEGNTYRQERNPNRTASLLSGYIAGRWTFVYEFGFKAMAYWGTNDKYCFVTRYPNDTTDYVGSIDSTGDRWVGKTFNVASSATRSESDRDDKAVKLQHVLTEYDPTKAFWNHMKDKSVGADVKQMFITKIVQFGAPKAISNILDSSLSNCKINGDRFIDAFKVSSLDPSYSNVADTLRYARSSYRINLSTADRQLILDFSLKFFEKYFIDKKTTAVVNASPAAEDLKLPAAFAAVVKYVTDNPGHAISPARSKWIFERLCPNLDTYDAFYTAVHDCQAPGFEKICCDAVKDGHSRFPDIAKYSKNIDDIVKGIKDDKFAPPARKESVKAIDPSKGIAAVHKWLYSNNGKCDINTTSHARKLWIGRNLASAVLSDKYDLNQEFSADHQFICAVCSEIYSVDNAAFPDSAKIKQIGDYLKANKSFPTKDTLNGNASKSTSCDLSKTCLAAIKWVNDHPGHTISPARARKFCFQITYDDVSKHSDQFESQFSNLSDYQNFCVCVGNRYRYVKDYDEVHPSFSQNGVAIQSINFFGNDVSKSQDIDASQI